MSDELDTGTDPEYERIRDDEMREKALMVAASTYKQFVDQHEAIHQNIILEVAEAFYQFLKGEKK